jgi:hypothetical protein
MKPLPRIILIVIISFAFCQLMFLLSRCGLKVYNKHNHERLNEILQNHTRYDLIFLGSSIAHGDMDPRIIDSICNISSYNAGVEGGNLVEFKMIFDAYLVNHPPPEYLILTLDLSCFNLDRKFFNHLDYYPYLSNKVVDHVLCNNSHHTALLKIFPFLELTEYDEEMRSRCVKGLLGKTDYIPGQIEYKGFRTCPMKFHYDHSDIKTFFMEEKISEGSLKLFQGIKDTCKARKIKLVIIFPPQYKKEEEVAINSRKILKTICTHANDNKIHFLEDENLSFCADSNLFSDFRHLNRDGAEVYSEIVGKELSGLIRDP